MKAALMGLSAQKERIEAQIAQLQQALGKRGPGRPKKEVAPPKKAGKKRRKMSPEARERIAAAQRKRWAAARKAKE